MKNDKKLIKYSFSLLDEDDIESFNIITKWNNDSEIAYLITPNLHEEILKPVSRLMLQVSYERNKSKRIYMIKCGEKIIGSVSIDMNPFQLVSKTESSGWLGIVIGEKDYIGKGAGEAAMKFVENIARELGATRMELGVFAFNKNAISFYEKQGYKRFCTIKNFTFYRGKWYDDYRMEKKL